MTRVLAFLKHNAIAIAALFIALGGTSYAAVAIPRNSVGTKQLRNGAVTPAKLATGTGGEVAAVTQLNSDGGVVSSNPKTVKVTNWQTNQPGLVSESGIVTYPHPFPKACLPIAMPVSFSNLRGQDHLPVVSAVRVGRSGIQVGADAPTFINLAVVCPR